MWRPPQSSSAEVSHGALSRWRDPVALHTQRTLVEFVLPALCAAHSVITGEAAPRTNTMMTNDDMVGNCMVQLAHVLRVVGWQTHANEMDDVDVDAASVRSLAVVRLHQWLQSMSEDPAAVVAKSLPQPDHRHDQGASMAAYQVVWIAAPLRWLAHLLSHKLGHLDRLISYHLSPSTDGILGDTPTAWPLVAAFCRHALGDVSIQLSAATVMLHSGLVLLSALRCSTQTTMTAAAPSPSSHGHAASASVALLLHSLSAATSLDEAERIIFLQSTLQRATKELEELSYASPAMHRDDGVAVAIGSLEWLAKVGLPLRRTSAVIEVHTSDMLSMIHDGASSLMELGIEAESLFRRIQSRRGADETVGATTIDSATPSSSRGDNPFVSIKELFTSSAHHLSPQLAAALDVQRRDSGNCVARLLSRCGEAVLLPMSTITKANEALTASHVALLNSMEMSTVLVQLLSSYQTVSLHMGSYERWMQQRSAITTSQVGLGEILIGIDVLQQRLDDLESTSAVILSYCEAVQSVAQGALDFGLMTVGSAMIGNGEVPSQENLHLGSVKHRMAPSVVQEYFQTTLTSLDTFASRAHSACAQLHQCCHAVDEACLHVVHAFRKLLHDQAVGLFAVAQVTARILDESRVVSVVMDQEKHHFDPTYVFGLGGPTAAASEGTPRWSDLAARIPTQGSSARSLLLLVVSTASTIREAVSHLASSAHLRREGLAVHRDAIVAEQRSTASQLVDVHTQLQAAQVESLHRINHIGTVHDENNRMLTEKMAAVAGSDRDFSGLDRQFIFHVVSALIRQDIAVSYAVHDVVSRNAPLDSASATEALEAVRCFSTTVELLSKLLCRLPPRPSMVASLYQPE